MAKPKTRTCAGCGKPFVPRSPAQRSCSMACGLKVAREGEAAAGA